uniref:CX domain-containing protein n=1 Tax=Caenorhabditis tropicalis TaxID=1561998 RepID=A0A1I7UKE7_9PELO
MKVTFSSVFLHVLLFSLFYDTVARGGGGRGGRGRGRGRSGARGGGGGAHGRSSMRSGIRGSSSYSGGVRSGAYGYKVQSQTSSVSDFGSKGFRTSHFYHTQSLRGSPGHPFVVVFATAPLLYDNRNYYWSYSLAKSESNSTHPGVVCEYVFGEDDAELQNVTFLNGTEVKSIFFGCAGKVACCGMYCCHDFDQWFELLFVFGFISLIIFIAYYAKKREQERPSKDSEPLRKRKTNNNPKPKK